MTAIGLMCAAFGRHQQRVALTCGDVTWTYGDLRARIYRMARALRKQGFQRGDVLALLTGNRPETFVLRYAANVLGCCAALLYDGQTAPVLAGMLRATGARALVFTPGGPDEAQALAAISDVPGVSGWSLGPCQGADDLAALADAQSAQAFSADARPGDLSSIRFTGGTTGTPKGVPHDFRVPRAPAAFTAEESPAPEAWENHTQLLCSQVGHFGGTLAEAMLAAGSHVVLHERFDAGQVLTAIETEQITFMWLLPSQLYQLLDHPAIESTDTSSLRTLIVGGWATSPHRIGQALQRFGPVITQSYGTFEAGQISVLSAQEHLRAELLTTVGRPVAGAEVSILGPTGEPLPKGVTGEICVRGPAVMTGYHDQPRETAQVLHDGWFHTGDLGYLNTSGYLTITGRSKDVILAASDKVYPAHVENALLRHPGIQAASVFGITEPDNTERVCAAVVPAPTARLTQHDIVHWVGQQCGTAHAPQTVLLLDSLPVTGSQKPDRTALRTMASTAHPTANDRLAETAQPPTESGVDDLTGDAQVS